jgi:hypothetical protein
MSRRVQIVQITKNLTEMQIKKMGLKMFQFVCWPSNLPAAEAAAAESEATVGVRAPATVCKAAAAPASICLVGCNYRTCSKHQYCRYNTYNTEYKKKSSIHYTIILFYLFIRYNTSLHLLYVQTNSVERIHFISFNFLNACRHFYLFTTEKSYNNLI